MDFSVLLSIYTKESVKFFEASVNSVVNQTRKPAEIVIVKDGILNQKLNKVCDDYKQKYGELFAFIQLEENQGLGKALQIGLKNCKYDLIARMDTDDIAKPDRFEKQIREFENDASLTILGSAIEEFSSSPEIVDTIRAVPLTHEEIYQYAKRRNPFNHMTVMFKKSAVLAVGNYQPFHFSEDYYLWFRLLYNGYKAKNLSDCLVSARVDKNMFQRRGGLKYFLQEIKLQNIFYKNKFITLSEYVYNLCLRMTARLLPNALRGFVYRKYLRK